MKNRGMKSWPSLLGVVTIVMSTWSYSAFSEEESISNPSGMVEVEPIFIEYSRTEGEFQLLPFRERRSNWGNQFSIGYSRYTPYNYTSEMSAFGFDEAYGYSSEMPLIEIQYTLKRNFIWGSLGAELGVGYYQNSSDIEAIDSELTLIPVRLGATLILDGLTRFPYIAPYGTVGAYTMVFNETQDGENTFEGNTQVAPYFSFGAQLNLDWLDPISSRQGYEENGIQATFLYIEGRKFIASSADRDKDFENDIEPNAGIRMEF